MAMSYELLYKITGGFSKELEIGRGTFGVVYKGKVEDGQEIAVKVLNNQSMDLNGDAFRNEFNHLTKLEHPNIVRLVGFCDHEEKERIEHEGNMILASKLHRALCFEYLHNGSLQNHLSDDHQVFDWQKRYMIIKGICMGLKYLHTGLESPVYHLDLKPGNILLGDNMAPKISDFGISKLIGQETTIKLTRDAAATFGYCPPEFLHGQIISKEFDIYSLGVIIIKIICGPAAHSPEEDEAMKRKFIRQVYRKWRKTLRAIKGYTELDVDCQCKQVKKCIEIALNCTVMERKKRPNIESIVDQLETEKRNSDKANSMNESHANTSSLPEYQSADLSKKTTLDFAPERELGHSKSGSVYKPEGATVARTLPASLPLTFMREITNDFSAERVIGRSVFGTIYKGVLPEGSMILVKRIDENAPIAAGKIFETEITNLKSLKHENLVELVHYCHESRKNVIEHNGRYVIVEVTESCLCYTYLPNGSLDKYIYADTASIRWDTRFKIIKGICQGLHFLHKESVDGPLIHMNLVPNSIWLDDNLVPKITDFGLSRLFGVEQTRMYTVNVKGHNGYIAPEYLYRGEISTMSDIYSLGMIILEITTREKNNAAIQDRSARQFIDNIHQNWKTDEQIMYKYPSLDSNGLQQVKACLIIGLKCVETDRKKRPSIEDIVNKLNGNRVRIFDQIRAADHLSPDEITPTSTVQLYVHPPLLRFPLEPKKSFSCPLFLINRTNNYVAARLHTDCPNLYVAATLLCGIVPPRATYTLVVTMKGQEQLLVADEILYLETCIVRNKGKGVNLVENADLHSVGIAFRNIFREAKRSGADNVHRQKLSVEFEFPKEATSDQPFQYEIEIIPDKKFSHVTSVDVHLEEPWIMTSHRGGEILIWDYKEQDVESSFDFTEQRPVNSVRFIERKEWFVAGDSHGIIYVYNYETYEEVISFKAHEDNITSMLVHPSDPLVISSSNDHLIKIWNWEKGWECIRTLEGHSEEVMQVVFDPVDTDIFASASLDQTIKIWNISSSECEKEIPSDHLDGLPWVLTYTGETGRCLVTGFSDGITQIWDLETERCVVTLEGHNDRITCVYSHPELPILLTGSQDGTVRTWNTDTYRPENIFGIKLGAVSAFGYIKVVKRVVVACQQGIAIMEMM